MQHPPSTNGRVRSQPQQTIDSSIDKGTLVNFDVTSSPGVDIVLLNLNTSTLDKRNWSQLALSVKLCS